MHRLRLSRGLSTFAECFERGRPAAARGTRSTGLFGKPYLVSPAAFGNHARETIAEADRMSQQICAGGFSAQETVQRLDVLSDTLCKVVDLAAFVRISHPDPAMASMAQNIHEHAFAFMNELNTNRGLYDRVCEVLHNGQLSAEERRVADILKHDFEKSGIQFDSQVRQTFMDAANAVSVLGQHFVMQIGPGERSVSFDSKDLVGVSPALLAQLPKATFSSKVHIPLDTPAAAEQVLATAHNREVRRTVWHALKSAPDSQVDVLSQVLENRFRMSQLAGYADFASYELADKMMQTPATVDEFLRSLDRTVRPLALAEVARLDVHAPWDYSYRFHQHREQKKRPRGPRSVQYSLGSVFQGLSELTRRLYGIRFEPAEPVPGEVWDPEVRRLDVYDGHSHVGTVYCDLFSREGKQPNPAHFTIQCSRDVWPWENNRETHQKPVIALVCDFDPCGTISQYELQTLFHEMGHAVHSMIGRTRLHNVAGTRCATDFVELPSILTEKFASSPRVLHELLGAPASMPPPAARESSWETHHQIFLSVLDQALHQGRPPADICGAAHRVEDTLSLFPGVAGQHTRQFAQFGHLVSYGATYYSYLLDRCLANLTWDTFFAQDVLSEEGGERFRNAVLKWGGARDPRACIEDLLGRELKYSEVATYI